MTAVAYAIRTCLGVLLDGTTIAGVRVHDSAVSPIDDMIEHGAQPFIVFSIGDEKLKLPGSWQLLDAERELDIVIEVAVGSMVRIAQPQDGTTEAFTLDIPHTDDGMETSLDIVGRQIMRQLLSGGPWSDLLRDFAIWPKSATIQRGGKAEGGTRFAARQYVYSVDTVAEPMFGEQPEGPFARLLTMMAEDPRLASAVPLMRSMIVGTAIPDWDRVRIDLGLSDASYRAVGPGPFFRAEGEPIMTRATLRTTGRPPLTVDP